MEERIARPVIGLLSLVIVGAVAFLMFAAPADAPSSGVMALPALNAALNGSAALLLACGWLAIRRRRIAVHRACMIAATVVSTAFLVSYLTYHALAGSRSFTGQGWIRPVYFSVLLTHVVLAAGMVPFVLTTLWRAIRGDFVRHVRVARWTLPLWLYVSVTGVVVYWLLYHVAR